MTFEEMQRTVEFLVQHGAQTDARLEKLVESVQILRDSHNGMRESQATLTASLYRMAELVQEFQHETEGRFRGIDERLAALADSQKRTDQQLRSTDERLNAVISLVERHITGHNHGSPAS